jgi:NitT/TauT family transport system substrate-binding protein
LDRQSLIELGSNGDAQENCSMPIVQNRRRFLKMLSSAAAASMITPSHLSAQDAPPETTTIRLAKHSGICIAPQYIADDLLRAEGFTDVQYVVRPPGVLSPAIGRGEVDFSMHFSPPSILAIDAGEPLTLIAGVHVGCFELFVHEGIRSIRDLRGKKVGSQAWGLAPHAFVTSMAAYVGLNPAKDIDWVLSPSVDPKELFAEGKLDAFLGLPPEPQELRARKIGRVIVNSSVDRPWSQHYCCMLTGNRDFVRKNPAATKRVLRAILKATDFCRGDPAAAARAIVDRGFTPRYDYALQTLQEVPYNHWRVYDPEDTLRFYALRLREGGMIKLTPNKLIADATDWRFLNELKRELKG